MKATTLNYLLIIAAITLFLATNAQARNFQFENTNDQLRTLGIVAGTYILGNIFERNGYSRKVSYLASGLIVGTTLFIVDYYDADKTKLQTHKTQGTAIGIGFAWTITLGFGL